MWAISNFILRPLSLSACITGRWEHISPSSTKSQTSQGQDIIIYVSLQLSNTQQHLAKICMPVHIYLNKWHDEARFQFCFILKECVSVSHLHFQPIFFLSSLKKKVIDPNRILISYPNIQAPLNLQLYTASFCFFFCLFVFWWRRGAVLCSRRLVS